MDIVYSKSAGKLSSSPPSSSLSVSEIVCILTFMNFVDTINQQLFKAIEEGNFDAFKRLINPKNINFKVIEAYIK